MISGLISSVLSLVVNCHEEKTANVGGFSPFLLLFLTFLAGVRAQGSGQLDEYYKYNIGTTFDVTCPPGWTQIATNCFKLGTGADDNIKAVGFDEANILCSTNLSYSRAFMIPNWFISTSVGTYFYPELIGRTPIDGNTTSTEVWTSYHFDVDPTNADNNTNIPPNLSITNSNNLTSIYVALWAKHEPQAPTQNLNCISFDINYKTGDVFGWRVKNCSFSLPVICQTFGCINATRCADNSKCIPFTAVCNGIRDCSDNSDENDCPSVNLKHQIFNSLYGGFQASAGDCFDDSCEYDIIESFGMTVIVKFVHLNVDEGDVLTIQGMTTGKTVHVRDDGQSVYIVDDFKVKIRYRPTRQAFVVGGTRGFQIRYMAEPPASCTETFSHGNGSFFTPKRVDSVSTYRPGLNCQWTVLNNRMTGAPEMSVMSFILSNYSLADGDWLKIFEYKQPDVEERQLIGSYTSKHKPPTAFTSAVPGVVFEFYSSPDSQGDLGLHVVYQQTCENVLLTSTHGRIESPEFNNREKRVSFDCSWVIDAPCLDGSECGITFYFDTLNLTDKDSLSIHPWTSDNNDAVFEDQLVINGNSLPVLFHHSARNKVILKLSGRTVYFAAQISYSIDCPRQQLPSGTLIRLNNYFETKSTDNHHFYRATLEISCSNSPNSTRTAITCDDGGTWSEALSSCDYMTCTFPRLTNGQIISVVLPVNGDELRIQEFNYTCNTGFHPPAATATCQNGTWNNFSGCTRITCNSTEPQYSSNIHDNGALNASLTSIPVESDFMSHVVYACNDSISSLRGNPVRYCKSDHTWSTPALYCKKHQCPQVLIENGRLNPPVQFDGFSSVVECFDGYYYSGNTSTVSCINGDWTPSVGSCNYLGCQCGPHGSCEHDVYPYCKCKPGFRQDAVNGTCSDIDECTEKFDLCSVQGTQCVNSIGDYSCTYQSTDSDPMEIYPAPDWIQYKNVPEAHNLLPNKSLVFKRCPIFDNSDPDVLVEPNSNTSLFLLHQSVTVFCRASLKKIVITCVSESGVVQWDKPNFDCLPDPQYQCLPPVVNPGIEISPNKTVYNLKESVNFTCSTGTLVGRQSISCVTQQYRNSSRPITTFYGTPPSCLIPQCTAIKADSSITVIPDDPTQLFRINSVVKLQCTNPNFSITDCKGDDPCFLQCGSNLNWYTKSSQMLLINMPHCQEAGCVVKGNGEVEPLQAKYSVNQPIQMTCVQPNYVLSDDRPLFCQPSHGTTPETNVLTTVRDTRTSIFGTTTKTFTDPSKGTSQAQSETDSPLSCIDTFSQAITAPVGTSVVMYCNLRLSCVGFRIQFKKMTSSNSAMPSSCIGIYCFTTILQLQYSDNGEYICQIVDHHSSVLEQKVITLDVVEESNEWTWDQTITAAAPLKETMFALKPNSVLWDKSPHWSFINSAWVFTPSNNKDNHLITPMIRVESESGDISIETSYLQPGCEVQLAYFTANYFINSVPADKFLTILRLNSTNPSGHTTIKIVYSILWMMIKTVNCDHVEVKSLDLTRISCPGVRLGLTSYPTTTTSEIDILVIGTCSPHSQKPSFSPQLVCSKSGKWKLAADKRPPSGCFCDDKFSYSSGSCVESRASSHEISKRNFLSSPLPTCVDTQPMKLNCLPSITVKRRNGLFSEKTAVPWPEVVDNDPHFKIFPNNRINADPYIFKNSEQQIRWTALDKHNQVYSCTTEVLYEDHEEPELICPDMHIDMRAGTTSKDVELRLPSIYTKDLSPVQLVFSPVNNSIVQIAKPVLVNVTGIDSTGNLAQCQFWYLAVVEDCPLWMIDQEQFLCTVSDNVTICYRRTPCKTRELPFDFKAIVCIPGHGWRFVKDNLSTSHLDNAPLMVRNPKCLEHISSSITLSILFRTPTLKPDCLTAFIKSMAIKIDNFIKSHCPAVGWNFVSKENSLELVSFNYSTSNQDTDAVLSCISDITESLAREMPDASIPCAPAIRSHTITYHVYCEAGWGANTNLKCEKCPAGYYANSEVCVACPLGTFSTNSGSSKCFSCPFGTTTINAGADSEDECVSYCPSGYFSKNGVAPCIPCSKGTFQENPGQSGCKPCPSNLVTEKPASSNPDDCRIPCAAGTYTAKLNSVYHCVPCPRGYYQELSGKTTCDPCPDHMMTLMDGASTRFQCVAVSCQNYGCKNEAKCQNHECQCPAGYAGYDCSVVLNLCSSAYCLNDATCFTDATGSHCICKNGFIGDRCEISLAKTRLESEAAAPRSQICDLNACSNGTCDPLNNGRCICNDNYFNNGNEECVPMFDGSTFDYCITGYVENAGYLDCDCKNSSRFGDHCEVVGDCGSDYQCEPNGYCATFYQDQAEISKCVCNAGFTGPRCNTPMTQANTCPDIECLNGASLDLNGCYCKCLNGSASFGETCNQKYGFCYNDGVFPCFNGAVCQEDLEKCICPPSWTGQFCDVYMNDSACTCFNGGSCVQGGSGTICSCPVGYSGSTCNSTIDPCLNYPQNDSTICNSGHCRALSPGYLGSTQCSCNSSLHWSGSTCMDFNDPCASNQNYCVNGRCVYDFESQKMTCICNDNYKGDLCNQPIDHCLAGNALCFNVGTCFNNGSSYKCDCQPGYDGANCESNNPCADFTCQNNGTCFDSTTGPKCHCKWGFEGDHCEKEKSFCQTNNLNSYCNNNGVCVDESGSGYCQCYDDYYGITCSYKKTKNYNLLFNGLSSNSSNFTVRSTNQSISLATEFTLCAWIKYGNETTDETSFLFVATSTSNLLEINKHSVILSDDPGQSKLFSSLDTNWHHLCLQTASGKWRLYVDAAPRSLTDADSGALASADQFWIQLGSKNGSRPFAGEISVVELYSTSLIYKDIFDLYYNCIDSNVSSKAAISWVDFSTVPVNTLDIIMIMPGVCAFHSCRDGKCVKQESNPPQNIYCPPDQHSVVDPDMSYKKVVFDSRTKDVDQMFKDENVIVDFQSNYRSEYSFPIGQYLIIFIATDLFNNSASCEFTLTIAPRAKDWNHESDSTVFSVHNVSTKDYYVLSTEYGLPECKNKSFVIPKAYAPFYVKDVMNNWLRFSPVYGSRFHVPECTDARAPKQQVTGSVFINSTRYVNCSAAKEQLLNLIESGGYCSNYSSCFHMSCENLIQTSSPSRRKRDASVMPMQMYFDLYSDNQMQPLEKRVYKSLTQDAAFREVTLTPAPMICNATDYSLQFKNSTVAACAMTPRGYYFNLSQKTAEPCPENQYQDQINSHDCTPCPDEKMTGGVGSTSAKDCFTKCATGTYYSFSSGSCVACPRGTYNDAVGKLKCRACPEGTTTIEPASSKPADCVPCGGGQEVSENGTCIACVEGYYKEPSDTNCRKCKTGFTTSGVKKASNTDCNVINCMIGTSISPHIPSSYNEQKNYILDLCLPCARGFYQNATNATSCVACEEYQTTKFTGSSSITDCEFQACYGDGDAHCPDGLVCSCKKKDQCSCQPVPVHNSQYWWLVPMVCCFGIALIVTIVVIIWKKQLFSDWLSSVPNWMLKPLPKRLQEILKTDISDLHQDQTRRSRRNSFAGSPQYEMEREESKADTESIPYIPEDTVQETAVDNYVADPVEATPPPKQALMPPVVPKKDFVLQPPPIPPKPNNVVDVTQMRSHHHQQQSNNIELIKSDGRVTTTISSVNNRRGEIHVSRGPPAMHHISSAKPIMQPQLSADFRNPLSTVSPLTSAKLHRHDSSSGSETFHYSARYDNESFNISSRKIPGTTDYFGQTNDMSEGMTSARSITSTTSKQNGSFYSHRTNNMDTRPTATSSNTVDDDDDADAFFS